MIVLSTFCNREFVPVLQTPQLIYVLVELTPDASEYSNIELTFRMVKGVETRRVWQVAPIINDMGVRVIQERTVEISLTELKQDSISYLWEVMLTCREKYTQVK